MDIRPMKLKDLVKVRDLEMDCIKEYFQYNGDISEDIYQFLENKKDIIHCLWELYLKYENFDCSTWEQIDEMLEYWMYG